MEDKTGQQTGGPVHIFEATSLHRFTFEDEDDGEDEYEAPYERRMTGVVLDRDESYQ